MAPDDQTQFVSTREAAEALGVALRTVQLWVEGGTLKAWKTAGGHRRIARDSLDTLLRQRNSVLDAAKPVQRLRVLFVEDDPAQMRVYRRAAASWKLPIDVYFAADGFSGLVHAGAWRPHLLFIDLLMPGMDGFQMLAALGSDPAFQGKIVVVTGLDDDALARRGRIPQGTIVLRKPVLPADLRGVVEGRMTGLVKLPAS